MKKIQGIKARWKVGEVRKIEQLIGEKVTLEDIVKHFPDKISSYVRIKARKLGYENPLGFYVRNVPKEVVWREKDINILTKMANEGSTIISIENCFKEYSILQVSNKMEELGLKAQKCTNVDCNTAIGDAKEALGTRYEFKHGRYYLDTKPSLIGYVIQAANEVLREQGKPMIGKGTL